MADYRAPVKDMLFVVRELAGLDEINKLPGFEEATPDLVEAIFEEAAQLAADVIAPTNTIGDTQGTRVVDGQVEVPEAFKTAYQALVEGGWPGISMGPEYGGQGLPLVVSISVDEMLQSANLAWSLCVMLTHSAIHAIELHGSDEVKSRYLESMVSGRWNGTMNLTEPQAGSDLSLIRTIAVPKNAAENIYELTGQKIFITWGDHDMTDNIVHLVLARLPDAPQGVKGISLFIVPKYVVDAEGNPGAANGVGTVSVEHKLGIHGSPTCVLNFAKAEGQLIGEPNKGLSHMFSMMNRARLAVGLEGVSIAERAYQQALVFAQERTQGRVPGKEGTVAIIEHPDVRRMLLTMKAEIEAMRAAGYVAAGHVDQAENLEDPEARAYHQSRVDLLIPIIKGWLTETGQALTSLGVQIHGGMGYVEETGAAQYLRDARILTIYEGTTGIQAGDLVGRKIISDSGKALGEFFVDIQATVIELESAGDNLAPIGASLATSLKQAQGASQWLAENAANDVSNAGAVSYHMLMMLGTLMGGWQMARAALAADRKLSVDLVDSDYLSAKILTAKFYAEQILPRISAHATTISAGSATMMAFTQEQFGNE
jgi:alkylation response protein AidB-like acyl-CoA dehydrogenase